MKDDLASLKRLADEHVERAWSEFGLRALNQKAIRATSDAMLAKLQSEYEPETPQHILATFEFQRRLTQLQVRCTYWTCGIATVLGAAVSLFCVWLAKQ